MIFQNKKIRGGEEMNLSDSIKNAAQQQANRNIYNTENVKKGVDL